MNEAEFTSVVDHLHLPSGEAFPIPILLGIDRDHADALRGKSRVALLFDGREVGEIRPKDFFSIDEAKWLQRCSEQRTPPTPASPI
jgi:ATP sulfurylase